MAFEMKEGSGNMDILIRRVIFTESAFSGFPQRVI